MFNDSWTRPDIEQAVNDGVTIKFLYESKLSKLDLVKEARETLDPEFSQIPGDWESYEAEKLKSRCRGSKSLVVRRT